MDILLLDLLDIVAVEKPISNSRIDLIGYGSNGGYAPSPIAPSDNAMLNGGGGGAGGPGESGGPSKHVSVPHRRHGGGGPGRQFPQLVQ